MRRTLLALLTLLLLLLLPASSRARKITRDERAASLQYVQSLQNPDGGFRPTAVAAPSTLGATVGGLRAFRYWGKTAPQASRCREFIRSCRQEDGSFADTPTGTPDARSTAMGLMVLAELKEEMESYVGPALLWFREKARTQPDVYIAAAALDAVRVQAKDTDGWQKLFLATRNGDGTFGKTPGDSARAAITLLRLTGNLTHREAVAEQVAGAQNRSDGGFPGAAGTSDLAATYPMMRACFLLRARPDLAGVRRFVAACRNSDGGYGPAPGQPSTLSTTYFAAIVSHWLDEMEK